MWLWLTQEKLYANNSWHHLRKVWIGPIKCINLYVVFIWHNQKKLLPHKYLFSMPIAQCPHAIFPKKPWWWRSVAEHDLLLNPIGRKRTPPSDTSKSHTLVSGSFLLASRASSISSGYLSIYPIPVELQSVFRNSSFVESKRANSEKDVILFFNDRNKFYIACDHDLSGIWPLPHRLYNSLRGLHCTWNTGINLA